MQKLHKFYLRLYYHLLRNSEDLKFLPSSGMIYASFVDFIHDSETLTIAF